MKHLSILLLVISTPLFAQFGAQEVITANIDNPRFLLTTDIDTDGITDLITVGNGNKMYWLKGLDDAGNFDEPIVINDIGTNYIEIKIIDIDNDKLEDIVFLHLNNQISYLKKLDASGNFASPQLLISNSDLSTFNFQLMDIDEDDDLDIVTFSLEVGAFFNRMFTYENIDGNATFANENLIYSTNGWNGKIFIRDIDNDSLNDIVAYENRPDGSAASIIYFKNNKGSDFNAPTSLYQFDFLLSKATTILDFQFIDINNDGLEDITFTTFRELGEGFPQDSRYWLQNIDNQGNYAEIAEISYMVDNFVFGDIDGDTDQDLIGFDFSENEIKWYENTDGEGDFSFNSIVTNEVQIISSIILSDINNDGYLDLLTSSIGDDKIAWYPNNILNVSQFQVPTITVYPNPTDGLLHIKSDERLNNVTIYSTQGQVVEFFQSFETVNLHSLTSGTYFVSIAYQNGQTVIKKIIKE